MTPLLEPVIIISRKFYENNQKTVDALTKSYCNYTKEQLLAEIKRLEHEVYLAELEKHHPASLPDEILRYKILQQKEEISQMEITNVILCMIIVAIIIYHSL